MSNTTTIPSFQIDSSKSSMDETAELKKTPSRYQRLGIVSSLEDSTSEPKTENIGWSPVRLFRSFTTKERASETMKERASERTVPKMPKKLETNKSVRSHPIFDLADARRSRKAKKNPDLIRYMQYVKEGGKWDPDSDYPSIY